MYHAPSRGFAGSFSAEDVAASLMPANRADALAVATIALRIAKEGAPVEEITLWTRVCEILREETED